MPLQSAASVLVFAFTGKCIHNSSLERKLRAAVKDLGARVATKSRGPSDWNPTTTHLVADAPSRNFKFLCALFSRCIIIRPEYLLDSQVAGRFLATEPYEFHGDSVSGRVWLGAIGFWKRQWRKRGCGPLRGHRVIIVGKMARTFRSGGLPTVSMLRYILLSAEAQLTENHKEATFALVDPRLDMSDSQVSLCVEDNVLCLGPAFVTDLAAMVSVDPAEYILFAVQKTLSEDPISPALLDSLPIRSRIPIAKTVNGPNNPELSLHFHSEKDAAIQPCESLDKSEYFGKSDRNSIVTEFEASLPPKGRRRRKILRRSSKRRRVVEENVQNVSSRAQDTSNRVTLPDRASDYAVGAHVVGAPNLKLAGLKDSSKACCDTSWPSQILGVDKENEVQNCARITSALQSADLKETKASRVQRSCYTRFADTEHDDSKTRTPLKHPRNFLDWAEWHCLREWGEHSLEKPTLRATLAFLRIASRSAGVLSERKQRSERIRIRKAILCFEEDTIEDEEWGAFTKATRRVLYGAHLSIPYIEAVVESTLKRDRFDSTSKVHPLEPSECNWDIVRGSRSRHTKVMNRHRVSMKTPPHLSGTERETCVARAASVSHKARSQRLDFDQCTTRPYSLPQVRCLPRVTAPLEISDRTALHLSSYKLPGALSQEQLVFPNDEAEKPSEAEEAVIKIKRDVDQEPPDLSSKKQMRSRTVLESQSQSSSDSSIKFIQASDRIPGLDSEDLFEPNIDPKEVLRTEDFDVEDSTRRMLDLYLDDEEENEEIPGANKTVITGSMVTESPVNELSQCFEDNSQSECTQSMTTSDHKKRFRLPKTHDGVWTRESVEDFHVSLRRDPAVIHQLSEDSLALEMSPNGSDQDNLSLEAAVNPLFSLCGTSLGLSPDSHQAEEHEILGILNALFTSDVFTWCSTLCSESSDSTISSREARLKRLFLFFDRVFDGRPSGAVLDTILHHLLEIFDRRLQSRDLSLSLLSILNWDGEHIGGSKAIVRRGILSMWLNLIRCADSCVNSGGTQSFWILVNTKLLAGKPTKKIEILQWRLQCIQTIKVLSNFYLFDLKSSTGPERGIPDGSLPNRSIKSNWDFISSILSECEDLHCSEGQRFLLKYLRAVSVDIAGQSWPVAELAVDIVAKIVHTYYSARPCDCHAFPNFIIHLSDSSQDFAELDKVLRRPCEFLFYIIWLMCRQNQGSNLSKVNSIASRLGETFLKSAVTKNCSTSSVRHYASLILAAGESFASEKILRLRLLSCISKFRSRSSSALHPVSDPKWSEACRSIMLSASLFRSEILMRSNVEFEEHARYYATELDKVVGLLMKFSSQSRGASVDDKDSNRVQRCILESACNDYTGRLSSFLKTCLAHLDTCYRPTSLSSILNSLRPLLSASMATAVSLSTLCFHSLEVLESLVSLLKYGFDTADYLGCESVSPVPDLRSRKAFLQAILRQSFLESVARLAAGPKAGTFSAVGTNSLSVRARSARLLADIVASGNQIEPSSLPQATVLSFLTKAGFNTDSSTTIIASSDGRVVSASFWSKLLSDRALPLRHLESNAFADMLVTSWAGSLCGWEASPGAVINPSDSAPLLLLTKAVVYSPWSRVHEVLSDNPLVVQVQNSNLNPASLSSKRAEGAQSLFEKLFFKLGSSHERRLSRNDLSENSMQTSVRGGETEDARVYKILNVMLKVFEQGIVACDTRAKQGFTAVASSYLQFALELVGMIFGKFASVIISQGDGRTQFFPLRLLLDLVDKASRVELSPTKSFYDELLLNVLLGFESYDLSDAVAGVYLSRFVTLMCSLGHLEPLISSLVNGRSKFRARMLQEAVIKRFESGGFATFSFKDALESTETLVRLHIARSSNTDIFLADLNPVMERLLRLVVEGRISAYVPGRLSRLAGQGREKCYEVMEQICRFLFVERESRALEQAHYGAVRRLEVALAHIGILDLEVALIGAFPVDVVTEKKMRAFRKERLERVAGLSMRSFPKRQRNRSEYFSGDRRIWVDSEQRMEGVSIAAAWCEMMMSIEEPIAMELVENLRYVLQVEHILHDSGRASCDGNMPFRRVESLRQLSVHLLGRFSRSSFCKDEPM